MSDNIDFNDLLKRVDDLTNDEDNVNIRDILGNNISEMSDSSSENDKTNISHNVNDEQNSEDNKNAVLHEENNVNDIVYQLFRDAKTPIEKKEEKASLKPAFEVATPDFDVELFDEEDEIYSNDDTEDKVYDEFEEEVNEEVTEEVTEDEKPLNIEQSEGNSVEEIYDSEDIKGIFKDNEEETELTLVSEPQNNENKKNGVKKEIIEWIESIAFSLVAVALVFTFIFRVVVVDGESMEYTLMDKDRVIISDLFYTPEVNDIIVFEPNLSRYGNNPFIKRVIAVEGDVVEIDKVTNAVIVNGKQISNEYIKEPMVYKGDQQYPLTVPEGHVFVMGDNRNESFDSRYVEVGVVDNRSILGRVIIRIYPFNKLGSIE